MDDYNLQALFTPREMEVLSAIGDGLTNKVIARRLNISLHTVKFHIESLFVISTRESCSKSTLQLKSGRRNSVF